MPKPLSDDLRCRILEAYARKEGSQSELARRFGVSFEFVRKLRKQFRKTGQMERVPQARHNAPSRRTASVRELLRTRLREQPDGTLAELGERLQAHSVDASRSPLSPTLRRMGLRRKKVPSRAAARHGRKPQAARRVPREACRDRAGEADIS